MNIKETLRKWFSVKTEKPAPESLPLVTVGQHFEIPDSTGWYTSYRVVYVRPEAKGEENGTKPGMVLLSDANGETLSHNESLYGRYFATHTARLTEDELIREITPLSQGPVRVLDYLKQEARIRERDLQILHGKPSRPAGHIAPEFATGD